MRRPQSQLADTFCTECGEDLRLWHSNLTTPATDDISNEFCDFTGTKDSWYFQFISEMIVENAHTERLSTPSEYPSGVPRRMKYTHALAMRCAKCTQDLEICSCQDPFTYAEVLNDLYALYDQDIDLYELYDNKKDFYADNPSCFSCDAFLTQACQPLMQSLSKIAGKQIPDPIRVCNAYDIDIAYITAGFCM